MAHQFDKGFVRKLNSSRFQFLFILFLLFGCTEEPTQPKSKQPQKASIEKQAEKKTSPINQTESPNSKNENLNPVLHLQTPSITANYYSMNYKWGSKWGGALDSILGGSILLDRSSSQPKGFLSRIYDGQFGNVDDPTGSFMIFDGPHAAIRIFAPAWREINSFGFYALETKTLSKAQAILVFKKNNEEIKKVNLLKKTLSSKKGLAHVKYYSQSEDLGLSDGEFFLVYDNPDFASAFISEIVVDGLSEKNGVGKECFTAISPTCQLKDIASWRKNYIEGLNSRHKEQPFPNLVFWQKKENDSDPGFGIHSLIIKTGNTGKKEYDLTSAWLAYPTEGEKNKIPLVVLVHDPTSPYSPLELLGLTGRPEFALAPALVQSGMAVLVVDLHQPNFGDSSSPYPQYYLHKVNSSLDQVLGGTFSRHSKLNIDRDRIGIWGNNYGASLTLMAALADKRYVSIGISRLEKSVCSISEFIFDCAQTKRITPYMKTELLKTMDIRKALIVDDAESMMWWRKNNKVQRNIVLRGAVYSFNESEKFEIVDFFSTHLSSSTKPKIKPGTYKLPQRPREFEPFLKQGITKNFEHWDKAWNQ